jgi:hypothetical protein
LDIPRTLEYLVSNSFCDNITEIIRHALWIEPIFIVLILNRKHKEFLLLLTRPMSFLPFSQHQVAARFYKFYWSNIKKCFDHVFLFSITWLQYNESFILFFLNVAWNHC